MYGYVNCTGIRTTELVETFRSGSPLRFESQKIHKRGICASSKTKKRGLGGVLNTLFSVTLGNMSSSVPEEMRPKVSQQVMKHLGATPGPVTDMFVVKTIFWHDKTGFFVALHVLNKLVGKEFQFVVNQDYECHMIVRGTTPRAIEKLETAQPLTFKFDDKHVKITKLLRVDLMPARKDIFQKESIQMFPASHGILSVQQQKWEGYPVGYSDSMLDLESVQNPTMSETIMSILDVVEGSNHGLLRVILKHIISSESIPLVYYVVPWTEGYKFAVYQNGAMYMKFDNPAHADQMTRSHYFLHGICAKFYTIKNVSKENLMYDKARRCAVYIRINNQDHFECHDFLG